MLKNFCPKCLSGNVLTPFGKTVFKDDKGVLREPYMYGELFECSDCNHLTDNVLIGNTNLPLLIADNRDCKKVEKNPVIHTVQQPILVKARKPAVTGEYVEKIDKNQTTLFEAKFPFKEEAKTIEAQEVSTAKKVEKIQIQTRPANFSSSNDINVIAKEISDNRSRFPIEIKS